MTKDKPIQRIEKSTEAEFINDFLRQNRPVIITGTMETWIKNEVWSFAGFVHEFGDEIIQVYNDRFDLKDVSTLQAYIKEHIGKADEKIMQGAGISYARLYTKMKNVDFIWADDIFDNIKQRWAVPDFIPRDGYILPFSNEGITPLTNRFPGKVIFISPKGARTSLHIDPWHSDAILCQVVGKKEVILFAPDQARYLKNGDSFMDLDAPDTGLYPAGRQAKVAYSDIINPGEVLFIPNGWLHHVRTLEDSISISWNFVHKTTVPTIEGLVKSGHFESDHNKEVLDYFITNKYHQ